MKTDDTKEAIARVLKGHVEGFPRFTPLDNLLNEIRKGIDNPESFLDYFMENFWGNPSRRGDNETSAVALLRPKTAALCYDRVWGLGDFVPDPIRFGGSSTFERHVFLPMLLTAGLMLFPENPRQPVRAHRNREPGIIETMVTDHYELLNHDEVWIRTDYHDWLNRPPIDEVLTRSISSAVTHHGQNEPTSVYNSCAARDKQFRRGAQEILFATLTNVSVVDESLLQWEQVLELRRDQETRSNYCRFLHWLEGDMADRSEPYIIDDLANKLDDYEKALRKHGIVTALGTISATLGAVSVPAIVSALSTQPFWMSLAEGVTIGGGLLAQVFKDYIDGKPDCPDEVAYVYEVKKTAT
jgi:hypothetical protein